jgi:hypothetical protein
MYSKLNAGAQTLHGRFSLQRPSARVCLINNECLESASLTMGASSLPLAKYSLGCTSPQSYTIAFRRFGWLHTHVSGLVARVRSCGGERQPITQSRD